MTRANCIVTATNRGYTLFILYDDLVHETADGVDHAVGACLVLYGIGVDDALQTKVLHVDVDVGAHPDGVAVEVNGTLALTMNVDATRLEGLDVGVVAQRLSKEVDSEGRGLDDVEGLHDDDIHHAILHRSARGDVGIVAILRSVGTGNEEGFVLVGARLVLNGVGVGLIGESFLEHIFDIGGEAALACLSKLQRYKGVEAHAAGAEERLVVDDTEVEMVGLSQIDDVEGFLHVHGQTEMTRQAVARAAGHDAKGGFAMNQRASHLVDGAVATYGDADVDAVSNALLGNLCSMTRILRLNDAAAESTGVDALVDELGQLCLRLGSRDGVDNENYRLFFVLHSANVRLL